ncbi:zinc finger protein 568 isoform X1 [Glossina fuscipes]|uniref:Zinc finger protein 568 isoform X1 n=1 Tax=Glossina fuscipes TaxID=7396 RepID=A0A8U0WGU3_9MUSC|nr:zinc finger protein 568 isoform X1 [Glossina fuscipes]
MNSKEKSCGQCGAKHTQRNRIITDSCSHQKCRHCFIQEENHCQQCAALGQSHKEPLTSTVVLSGKDIQNNVKKNKKTELFTHIEKVTEAGTTRYRCTECNKVFNSRSQKYYHLSCNTEEQQKLHKCEKCQKVFAKISHLKYHLESHTSTEWRCSQCSKVFGNRLILRKHEKIHDEKMQSITCLHCGINYRSKASLATHVAAKHNKILVHGCSQCDKSYASKSMLQQHLLTHQTKRYCCTVCGKGFPRNSSLKSHFKRHSKIVMYQCSRCWRNFTDLASFRRHNKQHQNSLKYRCIHCDTTILRKDNMLRHVRVFHSNCTVDQSIEIIKLHPVIAIHENCEANGTSNEEFHKGKETQSPKTIENSSVIKCIGNVEPVRIPYTCELRKAENIKVSNERNGESHLQTIVEQYEYRHKTPKKLFNIELYRRILEDGESNNDNKGSYMPSESQNSLPATSDGVVNHQPVEEKRKPLHWRKNFKYNYELTEF